MAILRKSTLALVAVFCLGVTVPVFAQAGADKSAADVKAAQSTVKDMQMLGAEIKARQARAMTETGSALVAAPVVRRTDTAVPTTVGKKKGSKKPGSKKAPVKKVP